MNNSIEFKQRKKWLEVRGIGALRRGRGESLNGRQQVEKVQIMVGKLVSSLLSFTCAHHKIRKDILSKCLYIPASKGYGPLEKKNVSQNNLLLDGIF